MLKSNGSRHQIKCPRLNALTLSVQCFPHLSAPFGTCKRKWKYRNGLQKCFKLLAGAGGAWASQHSLIGFHVGDNAHSNAFCGELFMKLCGGCNICQFVYDDICVNELRHKLVLS